MEHGSPQPGELEVSGLSPRFARRARARRITLSLATALLALTLILSSVPTLRQDVLSLLIGPTPTRPSLPWASSFYFLPTVPWVTVLVDGRALDTVPLADDQPQPLQLARGVHQFAWRAAPFQPLRCALPVPLPFIYTPRRDACPIHLYPGRPPGYVLDQRESLATLAPAQQRALQAAIAAGLSAASASAVIQPGEVYLGPATDAPYHRGIVTAGVPLQATLRFTPDLASGWSEPCLASSGFAPPCRFPDQDCRQLCTATPSGQAVPPSADRSTWIAAAPVQASWELTASDGTVVGQGAAGEGAEDFLMLLRITWDGTHWHVAPLFGYTTGGPVADDTVCAPARDWLAINSDPVSGGPLVPGGPALTGTTGEILYTSGPDPTDGCFVSVAPSAFASPPSPPLLHPATFLLRFGVLVAVNAEAHQVAPRLPVADASEQAIAQHVQRFELPRA